MTIKKPTYKELGTYLGVAESTVKKYPKLKRDLMVLGLLKKKEIEQERKESSQNKVANGAKKS